MPENEETYEPPREPKTVEGWLKKIEHNTSVIMAWTRFFGIIWVISFIIWVFVYLSRVR